MKTTAKQDRKPKPKINSIATASSPIRWWRSIAAPNFHAAALGAMRFAVERIEMVGEPRWRAAVAGDAAAAIGMALALSRDDSFRHKFDLVMTVLVLCACEGDATACLVLSTVIRRLPGAGAREARLATSWLVKSFRPLVARKFSEET